VEIVKCVEPLDAPPRANDSNDFVANAFHEIQMAQQEGRLIELPEEQNEHEAT
jgi:hypothetical protein